VNNNERVPCPTFYYNESGDRVMVRFSVEDFNMFWNKLQRLSMAAKEDENE